MGRLRGVEIQGTTAVVTGGASGIGRGTALELARRGADVVLADIHDERLADTAAEITALGRRCLAGALRRDQRRRRRRARPTPRSPSSAPSTSLMNNAGISVLGPSYRVPTDDWQRVLDVNVLGLVRGANAFVPAMVERGHGYVVNTASIAGIWAYSWDCAPYITSKFAAYGYSEALARSLRPLGVGVSVLCPGLVHTNLGENVRIAGVPDEHARLVDPLPAPTWPPTRSTPRPWVRWCATRSTPSASPSSPTPTTPSATRRGAPTSTRRWPPANAAAPTPPRIV